MAQELTYKAEAAAGYDQAFGHVTRHFMPYLFRAARLGSGMQILDIAAGTGIASEAALNIVGEGGHVTAADNAVAMVEKARERLQHATNASVSVGDGQSLSFADESFDTVICSLGLMFFPDPFKGITEFRRVVRSGGRVAVSVNTVPERSYNNRINLAIARHVPSYTSAASRIFSIGDELKLRTLFDTAGLRDVEITTEKHGFKLPSFDAYFMSFEKGAGSPGQAYISLPMEVRKAVRENVRRDLGDTGGPIEIEVELRFASGKR